MKETDLKRLEVLLDSDVKGKKLLEDFIWINSHSPKYKKGECYKVTVPNHRIYGVPVINMKGKIVRIQSFPRQKAYQYTLELDIIVDIGNAKTHENIEICVMESDIQESVTDNKNIITAIDTYRQSIDF